MLIWKMAIISRETDGGEPADTVFFTYRVLSNTGIKKAALPCVLQLGDIIDGYNAQYKASERSLERVMNTFQMLKVPVHHTWGNHEFYNFSRDYLTNSKLNTKFLKTRLPTILRLCLGGLLRVSFCTVP